MDTDEAILFGRHLENTVPAAARTELMMVIVALYQEVERLKGETDGISILGCA